MLRKSSTPSSIKDLQYPHMGDQLKSNAVVIESRFPSESRKNNSFPNVPGGLYVGFNAKGSEMDSISSPTSPLEFRVFSGLGNPCRSPRASYNEGRRKTWDGPKVGLGIIDYLDDEANQGRKDCQSSSSQTILLKPQMMIKAQNIGNHIDSNQAPKSLPENIAIFPRFQTRPTNLQKVKSDVLFEIGGDAISAEDSSSTFRYGSLDSVWSGSRLINIGNRKSRLSTGNVCSANQTFTLNVPVQSAKGCFEAGSSCDSNSGSLQSVTNSGTGFIGSLSASEIERSEDYTCVRTHGLNPKTTHIFGDCILECHSDELIGFSNNYMESVAMPQTANNASSEFPSDDFLSFCYSCQKKLDGKDIYIYRGEKAFCSDDCRLQELLIDEEMEKNSCHSSEETSNSNSRDDPF